MAQRYLGVPLIAYAATRGYGWASLAGLHSNDRGTTDLVTRNYHSGTDGTFLVDLGNGTYNVTVTLGDARASHDDLAVWANGQLLASNVTTLPGQFLTASYSVTVGNGQLAVRIVDNGGRTRTFALDALAISPAAPASQVFPNNTIVPPLPPPSGSVVNVSTVSQLAAAVAGLQTGQTIMIAAGAYQLTTTMLWSSSWIQRRPM